MACSYTSTSLLLRELVNKDSDADGVDGLGGNEEVVMVVDDEPEQHEGGHAGDDGEEGLHLGGLPPDPCGQDVDRIPVGSHPDRLFSSQLRLFSPLQVTILSKGLG